LRTVSGLPARGAKRVMLRTLQALWDGAGRHAA